MISQISRFDPWKDPLGVIQAYRLVRKEIRGLQLVLAGSMALDDPEGWEIYRQVEAESRNDPLIRVFTNLTGVGNIEVNAFQRLSSVVVQKSIREGFGLVVSEALWKNTPVVAGQTGGIPLQMADGAGGILVDTVERCAQAIVLLLQDRERAEMLAQAGKARVREHFLIPRLVLDEIRLMRRLAGSRNFVRDASWHRDHDPVCGMSVSSGQAHVTTSLGNTTYRFCSERCRNRFQSNPKAYLGAEPDTGQSR
jgi:trehalose synthase